MKRVAHKLSLLKQITDDVKLFPRFQLNMNNIVRKSILVNMEFHIEGDKRL